MVRIYLDNLFDYPLIRTLNYVSLFLETILLTAFFLRFIPVKRRWYRSIGCILLTGTLWGIVVSLVDFYTHNSFRAYYAAVTVFPILITLTLGKGSLMMRLFVPIYVFTLSNTFEMIGICLPSILARDGAMPYGLFVFLFILRRFLLKIPFAVLCYFYLRHSPWEREQVPPFYWFSLVGISVLGYVLISLPKGAENVVNAKYNLLLALCFIGFFTYVFYLVTRLLEEEEKNRTSYALVAHNQFQTQYQVQVSEMTESAKRFRHDFKNHLFLMDALLAEKEYDKLHEYLLSLHQIQMGGMGIVQYCENEGVNLILNQKQTMAARMGIGFHVSATVGNTGRIRQADLDAIIFNLLDNAIEGAERAEVGEIYVDIHSVKAYLQIQVKNTTRGDVLKENPFLKTSKGNKEMHGMGIRIIHSIVEKYDGIIDRSSEEGSFTTKILLVDT